MTVAIVDDDPMHRRILALLLRKYGFELNFVAEHGQDCILKMQQITALPTVIILDIEMPVMDGYETARQLKLNWPQIKIIGYSSLVHTASISKMKDSGASDFVSKGSDSKVLVQIIKRMFAQANDQWE